MYCIRELYRFSIVFRVWGKMSVAERKNCEMKWIAGETCVHGNWLCAICGVVFKSDDVYDHPDHSH